MKKLRKYHKWPSLVIGLFLLLFCASGIIMNHRGLFATLDFPRWLMPPNYYYKNWNLASVKGFIKTDTNELIAFGNTGIWKTDEAFSTFTDLNKGLPKGIDHRKTFTLVKTDNGRLFAGTLFGLYEYVNDVVGWQEVALPHKNTRIVKLLVHDKKLIILTRSEMMEMPVYEPGTITVTTIPPTPGHDERAGLFRTLWVVHSGEIFGLAGKLIVDLVGLAVIFMTLTGFFYTFLPKFAKKVRESVRKKLQKANRTGINWHTLIGVYGLPILLITVITGMFLRPPLLIPIANKYVKAIPGTILATDNVWDDKLRDIVYDSTLNVFIISTSEGFISLDRNTNPASTAFFPMQPPVSVMGINAFEPMTKGEYLVASFSGIYRWSPAYGHTYDMITGQEVVSYEQGNPFGAIAVAGVYMKDREPMAIMDYGAGWMNLKGSIKPEMPKVIAEQPISWWNLALEIHTGRIFESLIGMFYILYVPLMGITTLVILITGLLMWWKAKKRKSSSAKKKAVAKTLNTTPT